MEAVKEKVRLQRYPAYKDSGVEWLGEIPEHWKLLRGNYVFDIINDRSPKGEEDLLSVSEHDGVKLRSESNVNMFMAESYVGYKMCQKGDLVINSLWAWSRGLGISKYNGIVSTAYSVYRPDHSNYDKDYLNYLLRIEKYVAQYVIASKGIWISRLQLSDWSFLRLPILSPPKQEQTAIATFLNEKCCKIDTAIAQKEKLIQLLKERKQIIIQNAVTKGLDPDVKMKDSGVEWIGEIPEHWEVNKLKKFITGLESGVSVNASESETASLDEIGVLKTSCVYGYAFKASENKKVFQSDLSRVKCPVRKGAIIISRMNAPDLVGASGLVKDDFPNLFLPDRLWQTVYSKTIDFDAKWLSQNLISIGFRGCVTAIATGSSPSMKNISKGDLLNLSIATPPIEEQRAITKHIEEKSKRIKHSISLNLQQIERLKEYKSSLIDAAVTGKIKVPNYDLK
ncbi:restriction endonuclease subunit S [Christiangramia fulva]|uniref:Restriction endonuclease subunit S n=1 Tax=Christiangramia fulva TaxID=2126553 RepID=A0A2R3Z9T0_9FLAO|nr:restriction endonuclease subunit S [Christiangramia fulva]AVR47048.1 restriction endonuclease subunit S [Christiangramia fulva]